MTNTDTKRLMQNLTKGLFTPDIDALRTFFAQGPKPPPERVPATLAEQQPAIIRLLGAGLIETVVVAKMGCVGVREFQPTFLTPRGRKLLDCAG